MGKYRTNGYRISVTMIGSFAIFGIAIFAC